MDILIILAIAGIFVLLLFTNNPLPLIEIRFERKQKLFTKAERSFLGILDEAVGQKYRIMGKVRVADLITPIKQASKRNWWILFNKISSKHVDYVLCSKSTLEVIAAIELDDASHNNEDRKKRDDFIDKAFKSAGIPLIRFKAQRSYHINTTKDLIETEIYKNSEQSEQSAAEKVQP